MKKGKTKHGAPDWIRTSDRPLRRRVLYPAELRARDQDGVSGSAAGGSGAREYSCCRAYEALAVGTRCRHVAGMWRLLIFVSLIPPVLAMALRWWFGTRVLATLGPRVCRADLAKWLPEADAEAVARRSEETAHVTGFHLWSYALREWERGDPKAFAARRQSKRMASILPAFMVVIITFALIVAKLHIVGAFALVFASVAASALFSYVSLGPELRAVAMAASRLRESGAFQSRDDEDAVVECAMAHAWHQSLPPFLRWLQGG